MIKQDNENMFVDKWDEICIVRFKCNLTLLSHLFEIVQYLEGNRDAIDSLFTIKYFKYTGLRRDIETIYNENKESKEFLQINKEKGYMVDSQAKAFLDAKTNKKMIIWEPIFFSEINDETLDNKEKPDVVYFQYFLLVLKYFEEKGYRNNVRISAGEQAGLKYNPIEYGGNWSRLRTFLYLYSPEELSKIYIYSKYKKSEKGQWRHVKAENKEDDLSLYEEDLLRETGKIFPLISLSYDIYQALVQTKCSQRTGNSWNKKLINLYDSYIDKYFEYSNKDYDETVHNLRKIKKLKKAERELEDIICTGKATENEIQKESLREQYRKKEAECKKLREELNHVEREEILNKKYQELKEKLIKENGFKNFENDSLLEGLIFVATLTYLDQKTLDKIGERNGLTQLHETCVDYAQGIAQLIENIIFHVINSKNGGSGSFTFRIREKKDAKYYIAKGSSKESNFANFMELYIADFNYGKFGGLVSKFVENIQRRNNGRSDWRKKLTIETVRLPHLFGEKLQGTQMEKYFEESDNIAKHYGLQILNSVVVTGAGSLYVMSGSSSEEELTETNFFFNEYKVNNYLRPDFLWRNGTAYIIYLPIKYDKAVNYGDVIAVSNLECQKSKTNCSQLVVSPKHWETVGLTSEEKAKAVDTIKKELLLQIKEKKVFYIDLSCVRSNNIYAYEVLSKAIFLLLHGKKLKDIALINIPNEYDVIKIFRQFALFYNRFGENQVMKGKSVYFIDANGSLDLLLYGSQLKNIKENLPYGKIYGGYTGEAMEIINHLCKRLESGKTDSN